MSFKRPEGTGGNRRAGAAAFTLTAGLSVFVCYWMFIESTTFVFGGRKFYTLFDDGMISMQYARNLASGYGLVWNPGDVPVEGFTNLLWTFWMAVLHLTGVSEATVSALVSISGAATVVGTALVTRAIAHRTFPHDDVIPAFALWGTLVYYPLVFWSLRGMEVGLIALLLGLSVVLTMRLAERRGPWDLFALGLVLSMGVLTRMEFLVTAGLVAAFATFMSGNRWLATACALGLSLAVTMTALTVFRYEYYGELLPNTYYLKLSGIGLDTRLARGLGSVLYAAVTHFGGLVALVSIFVAYRWRRFTSNELLILLVAASSIAYSVWVGGDAWEDFGFANRYLAPVTPLMFVLAAKGATRLLDDDRSLLGLIAGCCGLLLLAGLNLAMPDSGRGTPAALRVVANAVMAAAFLGPILGRRASTRGGGRVWLMAPLTLLVVSLNLAPVGAWLLHGAPHSDGDAAWAEYGLMLRQTTAPDARVAVTWAGAVSYFSQRPTLDELGKTDAVIAHGPNVAPDFRPGHSKWNLSHTIGELKPDLIASLFLVNAQDLDNIRMWGYEPLTGSCFYRRNSSLVDVDGLRAALERMQGDPRFGVFTCGPFMTASGNP